MQREWLEAKLKFSFFDWIFLFEDSMNSVQQIDEWFPIARRQQHVDLPFNVSTASTAFVGCLPPNYNYHFHHSKFFFHWFFFSFNSYAWWCWNQSMCTICKMNVSITAHKFQTDRNVLYWSQQVFNSSSSTANEIYSFQNQLVIERRPFKVHHKFDADRRKYSHRLR